MASGVDDITATIKDNYLGGVGNEEKVNSVIHNSSSSIKGASMLNGEEERRSKRSPSFDRRISLTINSDLTNENDKHSRTSERDMLESPELFCGKLGIKLLRIFEILLISCFMDNSRSNKFDSRPTARKGTAGGNCDASIDDANSSTDDYGRSVNLHMNNLCQD